VAVLAQSLSTVASPTDVTSPRPPERLTINHPDGDLTLLLQPSQATANLQVFDGDGQSLTPATRQMAGVIEHEPDSWVRVSIDGDQLDGVLSRRGLHYRIATDGERVVFEPLASNHHPTGSVVSTPLRSASADRIEHQSLRRATIALVIDSQFNEFHAGRGLEKALSIVNSVDGIYRHEFALRLDINTAIVHREPATDPHRHGHVTSEHMLRSFRDYRMTQPALAGVCLVHLFTGNRNSDRPVGLAWIDTACHPDGYDVSLSTPYRHDILLAAHEIAHNLGAEHDSDTYCAEVDTGIMWRVVSDNTSQYFSDCTRMAVAESIARLPTVSEPDMQAARAAIAPDPSPQIAWPPTPRSLIPLVPAAAAE
jgi:hypothetical protein